MKNVLVDVSISDDIVTNQFIVDTVNERINAFHFSVYAKVLCSQSFSRLS